MPDAPANAAVLVGRCVFINSSMGAIPTFSRADRIKTVHLSDVSSDGKIRLPGYGVFNFDELFKLLSGEGFDGSMIIEVYKDDFGDDSEITKSLEFLKELRYKYF